MQVLFLKSALVGSPAEGLAKMIAKLLSLPHRLKYPEMREVFIEEDLLPKILNRLLTSSSNVVDVGCHVGSFLSLVKRIAKSGHHIAIEASPEKAKWLRRKFRDVEVLQVAVADYEGIAVFEDNQHRPGFSRLQNGRPSDSDVTNYNVTVSTLDSALEKATSIELIKIDIEGNELAALKGGQKSFERCRPAMIFECGSQDALERLGVDRRELYDFITLTMKYEIFTFTDFLFEKGKLSFEEFRKCGTYPFRAFNFVALPSKTTNSVEQTQAPR